MIGLKRGTVKLVPYDPSWSQEFEKEKKRLFDALGDLVVDIQHIGSTSIPGIPSKPIIDIDIGLRFAKEFPKCKGVLKSKGYYFRDNAHKSNVRMLFAKGPEEKRTHYIHVVKYDGKIWKQDILFRDYLINHKKEALKYTEIKNDLARKFGGNRGKYTKNKEDFIKRVIILAKK